MPAKKRKAKAKTKPKLGRRQQVGNGIFGDAWKWTRGAARSVDSFAKKTKLTSKLLNLSPDPRLKALGMAADQAGYGRFPVARKAQVRNLRIK